MMLDLPWLPLPPDDFRARVSAFKTADQPTEADLRQLAACRLDHNGLIGLGKAVGAARARMPASGDLSPLRLVLLSDTTTDVVVPALVAASAGRGVLLDVAVSPYGQIEQQVFNPTPELVHPAPDVVMICLDARTLGLDASRADPGEAEQLVSSTIQRIRALSTQARRQFGAPVLLSTLPMLPEPWAGSVDRRLPGSSRRMIDAVNDAIVDLASSDGTLLLDVEAIASAVGRALWYDPSQWYSARLSVPLELLPLYADHAARLFAALRGRSKKCLVLDLDDTLWGGIVGDVGVDDLEIGQGSPTGEAHLALQHYALQCRDRGIVLAVCSKNQESAALAPFRQHPGMALREDHLAVVRANWDDKASNLAHIAKILNIGTDALVFVDDNPAERARVRQMLPDVAVPELPDDVALFAPTLAAANYFETLGLSDEDRRRALFYEDDARRQGAMVQLGDLDTYLGSLDMVLTVTPFDPRGRARVAQLINKSNQFNLTGRRYTEAQVAEFERDPRFCTMALRLADRFGDNGIIGVVIFTRGQDAWECDTWLMSCRVLGRRLEEAALAEVARQARHAGAVRLVGHYVPTAKNMMVANHFAKLGFACLGSSDDGRSSWALGLAGYHVPDLPVRVVHG